MQRGWLTLALRPCCYLSVDPIDLKVTVGLEREGGAGAKVRFWLVKLGGNARATAASTQRIKLSLRPTIAGRPGASVSIAGGETHGER